MTPFPFHTLCLCALALTACGKAPELDASLPAGLSQRATPDLVPVETLLSAPAPRATTEAAEALEARAARLEARAEALRRRSILSKTDRDRLER